MLKGNHQPDVSDTTTVPENFIRFGIKLPPMLLEMAGALQTARFLSLNYLGTKATWNDGISSATFSYYSVYSPFINHPAILYVKKGADLGSDDTSPTHSIVIDRKLGEMFLAEYSEAGRFISSQHPKRESISCTKEDFDAFIKEAAVEFSNLAQMQRIGMFEIMPALEDRSKETSALTKWMNQNSPPEVLNFFRHYNYIF